MKSIIQNIWAYFFGPNRIVTCPWCQKRMKTIIMEGDVEHIMCDAKQQALQKERGARDAMEMFNKMERARHAEDRRQIELYKQAIREMKEEEK